MITNDWNEIGSAIRERNRSTCMNCRREGDDVTLDVHHVVPRGAGGSHRHGNLILLCRQCHDAIHCDGTAPRIEWSSTGEMTDFEFDVFRNLWNELDLARYDEDEQCWYIPIADAEDLVDLIQTTGMTTVEALEQVVDIDA